MKRLLLLSLLTALLGGCVIAPYGYRDRDDYYHRHGYRDRDHYYDRDGDRFRDPFYQGGSYFPGYSYRDRDHGS